MVHELSGGGTPIRLLKFTPDTLTCVGAGVGPVGAGVGEAVGLPSGLHWQRSSLLMPPAGSEVPVRYVHQHPLVA